MLDFDIGRKCKDSSWLPTITLWLYCRGFERAFPLFVCRKSKAAALTSPEFTVLALMAVIHGVQLSLV